MTDDKKAQPTRGDVLREIGKQFKQGSADSLAKAREGQQTEQAKTKPMAGAKMLSAEDLERIDRMLNAWPRSPSMNNHECEAPKRAGEGHAREQGQDRAAEPISSLYEQTQVHHVGAFPQLEDQNDDPASRG
jgi:hypothetical protein